MGVDLVDAQAIHWPNAHLVDSHPPANTVMTVAGFPTYRHGCLLGPVISTYVYASPPTSLCEGRLWRTDV
jgi:hypothetical protein